ncbi:hypothetical protein NWF32_00010 [Pseudomonas qingdaonensis]|nr:hypothetical protein [Pseudomonas qingdaonensis]
MRREDFVRNQIRSAAKLTHWLSSLKTYSLKERVNDRPSQSPARISALVHPLTLNTSRPVDPHEAVVLSTIQGIYPDATAMELRRELDYLADRSLVTLVKQPSGV